MFQCSKPHIYTKSEEDRRVSLDTMKSSGPFFELQGCILREEGSEETRRFTFDENVQRLFGFAEVVRPAGSTAALEWIMGRGQGALMPQDPSALAVETDFWGVCGAVEAARWVFSRMLGIPEPPPADTHPSLLRGEAERWGQQPSSLLLDQDTLHLAFFMLREDAAGDVVPVSGIVVGDSVAAPGSDTVLTSQITEFVACPLPEWLRQLNLDGLALCGGAALWLITGFSEGPSDWDFFVCEGSWEAAERAILQLCAQAPPGQLLVTATGAAVTVFVFGIGLHPVRVQFVRKVYPTLRAVLDSFDLDCCCISYHRGSLLASPRGIRALRTLQNVVDPATWGASSVYRATKYSGRGFSVALPGLRWARLRPFPLRGASRADSLIRQLQTVERGGVTDRGPGSYERDHGGSIHHAYSHRSREHIIEELNDLPASVVAHTVDFPPDIAALTSSVPAFLNLRDVQNDAVFFAQPRGEGRDGGASFQTLWYNGVPHLYVHEDAVAELRSCRLADGSGRVVWANPRDSEAGELPLALRLVVAHPTSSASDDGFLYDHRALEHAVNVMRACLQNACWSTRKTAKFREKIRTTDPVLQDVVVVPSITHIYPLTVPGRRKKPRRMVTWRIWQILKGA